MAPSGAGLTFERYFTCDNLPVLETVDWSMREARIDAKDAPVFVQEGVEFPTSWSDTAVTIVASKYFRGQLGTEGRETSLKQMLARVVTALTEHGIRAGYFADQRRAEVFADELTWLLLHQRASFNSPCFVPDTLIWLEGGTAKKIEDVAAGDVVVSHTGRRQFVTEVYAREVHEPVYRLSVTGLPSEQAECTGNHPLLVLRRHQVVCPSRGDRICSVFYGRERCNYCGRVDIPRELMPAWVEARSVGVGDFVVEASDTKEVSDVDSLKIQDCVEPAECYVEDGRVFSQSYRLIGRGKTPQYWHGSSHSLLNEIPIDDGFLRLLGYYLSNGSCEIKRGRLRISFDKKIKRSSIEDAQYLLGEIFGCHSQIEYTEGCETVCVHNIMLAKFFSALCGVGAHNKKIPLWAMTLPPEKQCHLLVGIFRGDGHLSHDRMILRLVNEGLTRQVFILLRRCGFLPTLEPGYRSSSVTPNGMVYDRTMHTVSVSPQNARSLVCDTFPSHERLPSNNGGKRTAIEVNGYLLRPVTAIESRAYHGVVHNLEVEEDHSYSVGGMAAHNCWFNIGCPDREQAASACFILKVEDSMEGILEWYRQEGVIFSRGAGAGVNVSSLRAAGEPISKGGRSSGPLSFMRAADASAFSIKSGGTTRRSARMVVMNMDHPDIQAFIDCKMVEERKARVLAAAGYDDSLDGEVYATVAHQNCNMSVRITDAFMRAVRDDAPWELRSVTGGHVVETVAARALFRRVAEAAHACGDPGVQYDDTINLWHTCPNSGRINASNPCSEFVFLDDTACNLSSVNLLSFWHGATAFDVFGYIKACEVMITAMEILVGMSSYPTPNITKNSYAFRPLGIGPANLGALLMAMGLPYDSDAGRGVAAGLQAIMSGACYAQSARMAKSLGAFEGFAVNREPMLEVMHQHRDALMGVPSNPIQDLVTPAWECWDEALALGKLYGYRNAQISVAAPTGTISFMMGCTTTGIEPETSLVKFKKLVGGGTLRQVNSVLPMALQRLGYGEATVSDCLAYVELSGTVEGYPKLKPEHLPVFDCAFTPLPGGRAISPEGHIRMVAALQPFLSGSVSKTVNAPQETTVEEIERMYLLGWELGCKSLAIYRDGCKQTQPLTAADPDAAASPAPQASPVVAARASRRRLPDERPAVTHKFSVGGHEGYFTVGLYDDGQPGELFVVISKEGSTVSGMMDAFATTVSLALQYGVPLPKLIEKFRHTQFEPRGFTQCADIPLASSILDYIFRWLELRFCAGEDAPPVDARALPPASGARPALVLEASASVTVLALDAPLCGTCGNIMVRAGSCHACPGCGTTSGCS